MFASVLGPRGVSDNTVVCRVKAVLAVIVTVRFSVSIGKLRFTRLDPLLAVVDGESRDDDDAADAKG